MKNELWKRKSKPNKYQLWFNQAKRSFLKRLHPVEDLQGGAIYDDEGKLRYLGTMTKRDHENLFTDRSPRLRWEEDDDGNRVVIGLTEIASVERGKFYNVLSDAPSLRAPFIRDWLLEPEKTQVDLYVYNKDIELRSQPRRLGEADLASSDSDSFSWKNKKGVASSRKSASEEVYVEASSIPSLIPESSVSCNSGSFSATSVSVAESKPGKKLGNRKAIQSFTLKSRDRLKFIGRNAMCAWTTSVTLTYPKDFAQDGRTCKRHLNTLLTHIRKDYPGIKYLWFMEFQERGAPHFHIYLTCPMPGRCYINSLWYHITGTTDKQHLKAGTQVKLITNQSEAIGYITSYAGKIFQKVTPEGFAGVGRFWGCSRNLVEPAACLSDLSVYQLQRIRSEYLDSMNVTGREDRMNCYLWNGTEWAGQIFTDYYNLHLRPMIAESLDLVGEPSLSAATRPLVSKSPSDFLEFIRTATRKKIRKKDELPDIASYLKFNSNYSFPGESTEFTRKPRIVNLRRRALLLRLFRSARPMRNLTEDAFKNALLKKPSNLRESSSEIFLDLDSERPTVQNYYYNKYIHSSLSWAYGAGEAHHVTEEAFEFSEIASSDMHAWIISCLERLRISWHKRYRPRYHSLVHNVIDFVYPTVILKRSFSTNLGSPVPLDRSGIPIELYSSSILSQFQ